ncbi:MAG: aminopeptidase, partial [Parafannyhessea umbonata]|nr:aminopeptidase [Parafannyhessea umbonata]
MERPNAWLDYTKEQLADLDRVCEGYKRFISDNKIEREVRAASIEQARAAGYRDLEELVAQGVALKAGDKVYASNHGKGVLLVQLGTEPLESGLN